MNKSTKILGVLFSSLFLVSCASAQTYMNGSVERIDVSASRISYSQYGTGFSGRFQEKTKFGYDLYTVRGLEFIVFKTENWISLYPTDLIQYAQLLNATIDDAGIVVDHETLGSVIFPEYILGSREYNFDTPPPELNHIPFRLGESSSFLTETISGTTMEFSPDNLLDWDLRSCWVEGSNGSGDGEVLRLKLGGNATTSRLIFYSGFFNPQDLSLYERNARPKSLQITTDSGISTIIEVMDSPNAQFIDLPEKTNSVEILILDVYIGSEYRDCAISGIFADLTAYTESTEWEW